MSGSRSFSPARAVPSSHSSGFHLPPISTTRFDNLVGLDATPSQPQPPARSYDAPHRYIHADRTRRAAPRGEESPHASQQQSKIRSTTPSSIQESPRSPVTQQRYQQQQRCLPQQLCAVLSVPNAEAPRKQKRAKKLNHSLPKNLINTPRSTQSYPFVKVMPKLYLPPHRKVTEGSTVTSAAFSVSSGGATPPTSLRSTPSQGFAPDAQRHNAATCEAQIGKETSAMTKPTNRNAEDGEKGSDHSGAACAATTMAKPQSRKAEDESMQQLLRTFLAQRKGTNSTRRESLPATVTSTPTDTAATTTATDQPFLTDEMPEPFTKSSELSGLAPSQHQQQQQQQQNEDEKTKETMRATAVMEPPFAPTPEPLQDKGECAAPYNAAVPLEDTAPRSRRNTTTSTVDGTSTTNRVVRFHSIVEEEEPLSDADAHAFESRYNEALKSTETAASDRRVAMQRVQEFCDSVFALVETWMDLHDNHLEEFGQAVLQRLLEDNPSYRVMFYGVDLQRQAHVILDMLGHAVVAFTRPGEMMDLMGEIGARHNLYGVTESHFISMRDAFLQVYAEFVSPDTYNESIGIWRVFWKTTIELAVSGGSSERGAVYSKRRYKVWAARVNRTMKELIPLQRSGGFHRLMQVGYKIAAKKHPSLKYLSHLEDLRTAHRCMEVFLRTTKHVVRADSAPVIEYNDQFSVEHFFTGMTDGITMQKMKMLEEPFLEGCKFFLPATSWNDVVEAALQELWSVYIAGYWTAQPGTGDGDGSGGTAPDGKKPFCLMFTDIEASTRLWDCDTQAMGTAVQFHHQCIRRLIEDFGGYEVKTVGDSFLIATNDVTQALLIAFGIQLELMAGPSAPNFRMVDSPQGTGAASCWREDALRVRVGIHYCTDATAVYDSVHNRFDYYGPSVNCAARVEAAACGGQVLLSHGAYEQLKAEDAYAKEPLDSLLMEQLGKLVQAQEARGVSMHDPDLQRIVSAANKNKQFDTLVSAPTDGVAGAVPEERLNARGDVMTLQSLTTATDEGLHPLKGIAEPVQLYSLLPLGLTERVFPDAFMRTKFSVDRSTGSTFSLELSSSAPFSLATDGMSVKDSSVATLDTSCL